MRKPASEQESLSHWQSWRPAIAAGCTGTRSISGRDEITIPPGCWEMCRGRPAISVVRNWKARHRLETSLRSASGQPGHLLGDARRVPAVGEPGEPLELRLRQPERLADVADRAARAVGGEARDERRVLVAVPLGDGDDQLLADVAREVEVDVRNRGHLVVEEAPERELVRNRIDVREPGQVTDDRADRAAAAPSGRQEAAGRVTAAHLAARIPAPARAPPSGAGRTRPARACRSARARVSRRARARASSGCRSAGSGRRRRRCRSPRAAGSPARRRRRSRGSGSRAPR